MKYIPVKLVCRDSGRKYWVMVEVMPLAGTVKIIEGTFGNTKKELIASFYN